MFEELLGLDIVEQCFEIINAIPREEMLKSIERAARTCYKSEDKIKEGSAAAMVKRLISAGHHAMLEFEDITVVLTTNRGVTHETVRQRLASFAQESTRYCKYGNMKYIRPVWVDLKNLDAAAMVFLKCLKVCQDSYLELLDLGWTPQQAREVLPNALKADICVKCNIREWRHIFELRCAKAAHPQMRALMVALLKQFKQLYPEFFEDVAYYDDTLKDIAY